MMTTDRTDFRKRLARRVVSQYPLAWRERYSEEILDVLDQHRVTLRTVVNLMVNAVAARLDPAYRRDRLTVGLRRGLRRFGYPLAGLLLLGVAVPFIQAYMEPTGFGVIGATDVSFSSDGRLVLTVSGDSALRLWDLTNPAHPAQLGHFRGGVNVSLSPDGRTIASLQDSVVLWDVTDPVHPRKAATLFAPNTDAEAAVFSRDGRMLATGYHGSVILFNVAQPTHPIQLTPLPPHPTAVPPQTFMTMKFSPDGRTLATTSGDSDGMTLWDITDPAHPQDRAHLPLLRTQPGPKYDVMTFTPDSATLATADDGTVRLWNVAKPAEPVLASTVDTTATDGGRLGLSHNSLEVVITDNGRTMITVMNNEKASIWNIAQPGRPQHIRDLIRTNAGPGIFRVSPNGRTVVSAARPSHDTITVWPIA